MNDLKEQLNPFLCGDELTEALTVLPPYREGLTAIPDRLMALLDIYKIFLPGKSTQDIYNRLYLAILNSLEKKDSLLAVSLQNDNFRTIKGLKRYGVIGGLESFRVTGNAGLGKTTGVRRCSEIIADKILVGHDPYREIIPVLFIECVADGSFNLKHLIVQLQKGRTSALAHFYKGSKVQIAACLTASLMP